MIYILHFDEPLKHARHYCGYAYSFESLEVRIKLHARGAAPPQGARLTQVLHQSGIGFTLARILPGDRNEERRLKNTRNIPKYCPMCRRRSQL